jgi:hypothetical protein
MSYLRSYKGKAVLGALKMSATPQRATFDLSKQGLARLKTLISSGASVEGNDVALEPFGLLIAEVNQ